MSDSQYSNILMLLGLGLYKVSDTGLEQGIWFVFSLIFLGVSIINLIQERSSE